MYTQRFLFKVRPGDPAINIFLRYWISFIDFLSGYSACLPANKVSANPPILILLLRCQNPISRNSTLSLFIRFTQSTNRSALHSDSSCFYYGAITLVQLLFFILGTVHLLRSLDLGTFCEVSLIHLVVT